MNSMDKPSLYWFWLLAGPQCPAAKPVAGGAAGEPTLPVVLSDLADASTSHWWLHANSESRRQAIHLCRLTAALRGKACLADQGSELNLRSHNARAGGQPVHAYLLQGDPTQLPQWCLSGQYAEFHIGADLLDDSSKLALIPGAGRLARALAYRVYALSLEDSARPSVVRFVLQTAKDEDPERVAVAGGESYALLPGIALLAAEPQQLAAVLDAFLVSDDPQVLIAAVEQDPRDFLVTLPVCAPPASDNSFFHEDWEAVSDLLLGALATAQPDKTDWPPLLRLCLSARQFGLRDFLQDDAELKIDPLDSESEGLRLEDDWQQPVQTFRKWLLQDVVLDEASSRSWKGQVIREQRAHFFSAVREPCGWTRLRLVQRSAQRASRGERLQAAAGGYSSRLDRPPAGLLESATANLAAWLSWLKAMPEVKGRADVMDILDFLEHLLDLSRSENMAAKQLAPLCRLLAESISPGDDLQSVFFWHDFFVDELGWRLLEPAVRQLKSVPFAEWQPVIRRCLYYLLSVLTSPRRATHDWLQDIHVGHNLRLALGGRDLEPFAQRDRAAFRLPADPSVAGLARLLIPPRRLRSAGFCLGKSRLNQPAAVFG